MITIKICGLTTTKDALAAAQAGADALGFVFGSGPRQVSPEQAHNIIRALPPFVSTVGVFVNMDANGVCKIAEFCGLDFLQFQGDESPEYCAGFTRRIIKGFKIKNAVTPKHINVYDVDAYLLDTHVSAKRGGTGQPFDWELARNLPINRPVILAGGLSPSNVAKAINVVRPDAVDVSSGVAKTPRLKDHKKMADFIHQARSVITTRVAE